MILAYFLRATTESLSAVSRFDEEGIMLPRQLLAAAALVSQVAFVSAGPLTGQTLGASGTFGTLAPASAAVGPGVEFTEVFAAVRFDIDFDESGLLTVTWIGPGSLGHGATDVQTYTDINSSIADILGFALLGTSGVTGIDQSDLSFTANSITMSIGSGTTWDQGATMTAQIDFAAAAVPLPGTLALAGIGLLAAAGAARCRGKRG